MESTTSYTFPLQTGGIFYFPWHRHNTKQNGSTAFSVSSETHRDTQISNVESQLFTPNRANARRLVREPRDERAC